MITSTDIGNILYKDLHTKFPSVEIHQKPVMPLGDIDEVRIIVITKEQKHGSIFHKSYAQVNVAVPDLDGDADLVTLGDWEHQVKEFLDRGVCDKYDGTTYRYSVDSHGTFQSEDFKSHFVNVKVFFEVFNI